MKGDKIKGNLKALFYIVQLLFPIPVLLLVLYPFVIGLFIDYQNIEFNQLILLLIWVPIFSVPFLFTDKKVFYWLLVIIFGFNAFIDLGFWVILKTPINYFGLMAIFNTNLNEAIGFSILTFNWWFVCFLPFPVLLVYTLKNFPSQQVARTSSVTFASLLVLSIGVLFFGIKIAQNRLILEGMPKLVQSSWFFYQEMREYHILMQEEKISSQKDRVQTKAIEQPELYVLVIGESTARGHMSLYGYERETNPKLSKNEEIISYDNVISAFANTAKSVPYSLTLANLENHLHPPKTITLAEVFRGANFKTYWISNQYPFGILDNFNTVLAQQYEEVNFVKTSTSLDKLNKASVLLENVNTYDEKIFAPFQEAIHQEGTKKLIVIHLYGTHALYKDRYPEEFDYFTTYSTNQEKVINEYDNAVRYNDYSMDSILQLIHTFSIKNNAVSTMLYFSDHGETVYDCADVAGHHWRNVDIPKCDLEIPFVVWLSPEYKQLFPEKTEQIKKQRHFPYMTDDLFHSVLDLSNISIPEWEKERSIFHADYDQSRKRITADGLDYDLK